MNTNINIIQNNVLAAFSKNAPQNVLQAISGAAAKTGVNFAYLVQQAQAESSFNAEAEAKTSSATGLYQFIESTWLNVVEKYGPKHGISSDGKSREEILDMRKNPQTASVMAAEFAGENERFLQSHWSKGSKDIGSTELYFAHFLGAGKAAAFLQARDENNLQAAADIFPKAAAANRNVFYEGATGRAKTIEEVYQYFDNKFINFGDESSVPTQIAQGTTEQTPKDNGSKAASILSEIASKEIDGLDMQRPAYASVPSYLAPSHSNASASKVRMSTPSNINHPMISNPIELMLLSQLALPGMEDKDKKKLF